jgi:hypothetical protein
MCPLVWGTGPPVMKYKLSTYLFAAGAMAFMFIAINQGAFIS